MINRKPEELFGSNSYSERLSCSQSAAEIVGYRDFQDRINGYYMEIAGWGRGKGEDAMVLDDYGVLPEWAMAWYPGMVHQLFLERAGWFPLAGQRLKLCEANRFDNRFQAYEYLSRGERPICLVSSARYWGLRVWDDKPEDIARLKAAGKWKVE